MTEIRNVLLCGACSNKSKKNFRVLLAKMPAVTTGLRRSKRTSSLAPVRVLVQTANVAHLINCSSHIATVFVEVVYHYIVSCCYVPVVQAVCGGSGSRLLGQESTVNLLQITNSLDKLIVLPARDVQVCRAPDHKSTSSTILWLQNVPPS